jgi:hypothetical protein
MEPTYLSRSADRRQATDDLLKTWFRTTAQGQEYNIFVIIEREETSVEEASYDKSAHTLLKVKEEETEIKPIIKESKKKKGKRAVIKKEKSRSPVRRVLEDEMLNPQLTGRKRSFSDLSTKESPPSPDSTSYVYRTRKTHTLDEEDLDRIAQYD